MSGLSQRAAFMHKALKKVSECASMEEKIEHLQKAFDLFNLEASRLEELYMALDDQLHRVSLELEVANTQLNQKVTELHHLSQSLEGILTHISQGILFINLEGIITAFNPAAEELLNRPKDQTVGESFFDIFPDELFGYSMKEALQMFQVPTLTFASIYDEDTKKELEIVSTCVVDHEKSLQEGRQGIIIVVRDLTKLFHLQLQASRSDRMKDLGEMAAQMAHEIRNPLGGIKGFATLLERDLEGQPALQKMASHIIEGTDNLNHLVTNILNFSRQIKLHVEKIDLGNLLKEIEQHLVADPLFFDKIHIHLLIPKEPLICVADASLLKGALLNLAINSIQAMPEGGDLSLSLSSTKSEVIIKVTDTGIGIPEENLEKIFSPFFTTKIAGNGFGLPEVNKIVLAHNGHIDVESKVGVGSIFTLRIPLTLGE